MALGWIKFVDTGRPKLLQLVKQTVWANASGVCWGERFGSG